LAGVFPRLDLAFGPSGFGGDFEQAFEVVAGTEFLRHGAELAG